MRIFIDRQGLVEDRHGDVGEFNNVPSENSLHLHFRLDKDPVTLKIEILSKRGRNAFGSIWQEYELTL
jgi:hypothetical protein